MTKKQKERVTKRVIRYVPIDVWNNIDVDYSEQEQDLRDVVYARLVKCLGKEFKMKPRSFA